MKTILSFFISSLCIFYSCGQPKNELKVEQPKQPYSCIYTKDYKDSSGKHVRVIQDEKFISFVLTDSAAKGALEDDEYFKGYLSCFCVDTVLGINFNFKIYSADAFHYLGMIKKDNKINFILKSGKAVELSFGSTTSGNTDLSKEFTEYSSFANLSSSQAKQLTSEALERVRISWSKKDEEYMVVNPNIFINQVLCLQ